MPLQIRRGTNVERQAITPAPGELIFVTNTSQLFVGNGVTVGGILATGYTNNDAQDAAAVIFTANNSAHSNINFAYNTSLNLITAAVNLSDYAGVIKADAFKGSVFADDGSTVGGTELVNAVDGSLNLNGTVKDHVIPDASLAYDLGSAALRFRDLYLSGSSIELGAATITATGSAVNLPAGSTVGGVAIGGGSGGNISGTFLGDIKGSVFGDDSTTMVDSVNLRLSNGAITLSQNNILVTGGTNPFALISGNPYESLVIGNESNPCVLINYADDALAILVGRTLGPFDSASLQIRNARGTFETPTVNSPGDLIAPIQGYAYDGVEYTSVGSFGMATDPNTAISAGSVGGAFFISAQKATGGDSRLLFDSDGILQAPIFKTGSFTDVTRDSQTAAVGMIIYNTTTNKFQGYQNTGGTTPEWVDLS